MNNTLKRLRVNSIKDPDTRRILKPCEARAGHGAIAVFLGLLGLVFIVFLALRFFRWVIGFFTN